MKNKVTIVIPTFNRSNLVCDTIDSALAQTVPCDIIVCDHGSSDNTPELMKKYGDKITYIRRERDFGPHFCWLEGVLNANTDLVHIHYDDDLMEPEFIEKTLKYMTDGVGMVFTDAKVLDRITNKVIVPACFNFAQKMETGILGTDKLEKMLLDGLMLSPALCLYHRQDLIDAILPGDLPIDFGGNYHGVGPDLLANLLVCLRYQKCVVITESLVKFGSHPGSITVDAIANQEKLKKLYDGYDAFRTYYQLIKLYQTNKKIQKRVFIRTKREYEQKKKWNKRLERKIKLILKTVGLRKKEVK